MRVLGIGDHNDLGAMYLRMAERGHEVRVFVGDPASHDVLAGMIERSADWRADLAWVPKGDGGLILFESTGHGQLQDSLRSQGYRVVGGSELGDRLEMDRQFGQTVLAGLGLPIADLHAFDGFDDAIDFVTRTRKRYVLKFSGKGYAPTRSYVGVLDDGRDLIAALQLQRALWPHAERPAVLLMRHLAGVEVGVGAFFDGQRFIGPANLDWEHKRFFPGDVGELTPEMGTVVTYRGADRLFDATLGRMAPLLRESGYVGYINLNMIVNREGTWPLEFTCRFGYPGFAILGALHAQPWDVLLARLSAGRLERLETWDGHAVGVVLTVPPFPYPDGYDRLSKGAPICFRDELTSEERQHVHEGEVGMMAGQLVTAGQIGYVMVVTGRGASIAQARQAALATATKVIVPNVRYRMDIGERLERQDHATLVALGWL